MEVLLVRHGDPDYENDTLTETGHREAEQLATSLAGQQLDSIYASPLGRAQDTMRYTANLTGVEPVTLGWLEEISAPPVDGLCAWELPGHYSLSANPLPTLENWSEESVFGESFLPFYDRIAAGFDELMSTYGYRKAGNMYRVGRQTGQRIALFCHKGTILTLLSYLLHWPLPLIFVHLQISPTGVSRLIWQPSNEHWATPKSQVLNDLSHLRGR